MNRRALSLPPPVSPRSTLIHQEFVGLDHCGARIFSGVFTIGSSAHSVTIKRIAADNADDFTLPYALQDVIDAEPGFLNHLFVSLERNDIVIVSGRYLCVLRDLMNQPNGLTRLPPWQAFRQCMELVRKLHRSRYTHNSLDLDSFVIVDTGCELEVQMTNLWRARPSGLGEYAALPGVNSDLVRLGFLFEEFLELVRAADPDNEDDRFPLLADLVECLIRGGQLGRGNLDHLLTHPSVKSYERLLALACAASDLITNRVTPNRLGQELLVALNDASGDDFVAWVERFPNDIPAIDGDYRDLAHAPLLWNLLDRHDSLQNVLRVFRNRSSHRLPIFAFRLGEIPTGFTQSWVQALPQMWTSLWAVLNLRQFRSYFHDYLREP
jgi:hypothetical protein